MKPNRPKTDIASLDRRRFLRGSAIALALPSFECFATALPRQQPKRFACVYQPNGVPMPLAKDPAHKDWSWFPHGSGKDFTFTKCLEPLTPLRQQLTVVSGMSHPAVRTVQGHSNGDQFLTGADTGRHDAYKNSISLDQVFAAHVGEQTRYASLVLSTDGGTGTARGAHTLSFDHKGRAIPAAHRPKKIFDALFVNSDEDARKRLARDASALDDLLEDARALRKKLSGHDQLALDEYLDSVRDTETKIAKAKTWVSIPLPKVDADHLQLDVTADDARNYLRAMFGLMHLAFLTDSTRTATYQLGRENSPGISDYLSRACGSKLAHQLSHETKMPGGWKDFGVFCRFLVEEFGRFAAKLQATPEPGGDGNLLDNTLILFGSASSAYHLSRNYPLILLGGKNMGFAHGQYLNYVGDKGFAGSWTEGREPWQQEFEREDLPLGHLYVTLLQRLGVQQEQFAGCSGGIDTI